MSWYTFYKQSDAYVGQVKNIRDNTPFMGKMHAVYQNPNMDEWMKATSSGTDLARVVINAFTGDVYAGAIEGMIHVQIANMVPVERGDLIGVYARMGRNNVWMNEEVSFVNAHHNILTQNYQKINSIPDIAAILSEVDILVRAKNPLFASDLSGIAHHFDRDLECIMRYKKNEAVPAGANQAGGSRRYSLLEDRGDIPFGVPLL